MGNACLGDLVTAKRWRSGIGVQTIVVKRWRSNDRHRTIVAESSKLNEGDQALKPASCSDPPPHTQTHTLPSPPRIWASNGRSTAILDARIIIFKSVNFYFIIIKFPAPGPRTGETRIDAASHVPARRRRKSCVKSVTGVKCVRWAGGGGGLQMQRYRQPTRKGTGRQAGRKTDSVTV